MEGKYHNETEAFVKYYMCLCKGGNGELKVFKCVGNVKNIVQA